MADDQHVELLAQLGADPVLAHEVFFAHRHRQETPPFHTDMIRSWHSDATNILDLVFRGGGKSTVAEEAMIIMAIFRRRRHFLAVGESETRAVDRLRAIKTELETNEIIHQLLGNMVGSIWQETKVVLSNGVVIQAMGRGQSMRGMKHEDVRPDFALIDDLEDEESVRRKENRDETTNWFASAFLPSLEPGYKLRVAATPLDPDAFAMRLSKMPEWETVKYPIEFINPQGERQATWPARFPLADVDKLKQLYASLGKADTFMREYMVEAVDPGTRTFKREQMRHDPSVRRSWHAVYSMHDPARTKNENSATTGKAVWSWVKNRLVVWEAKAEFWMPDEIVDDLFTTDRMYSPVALGIEEDGLNEFLLQPIRAQMITRGHALPLRPVKAPKGKLDFIRGLQPFFKAGEVILAGDTPQFEALVNQFLSFPTGRIDAPNALAYALRLRPGAPLYDDFEGEHITEALRPRPLPFWLALNATQQETTAILLQVVSGAVHILADWIREGDPGQALAGIIAEAALTASVPASQLKLTAQPRHHFGTDAIGLLGAVRRNHGALRRGGEPIDGRGEVRRLLTTRSQGMPCFLVDSTATWTLRAMTGGFARASSDDGRITDFPTDNVYRTLIEGLEAFTALLRTSALEPDLGVRYAVTGDGRQYATALAQRGPR